MAMRVLCDAWLPTVRTDWTATVSSHHPALAAAGALPLAIAAERAVPDVFSASPDQGQMHATALATVAVQQWGFGAAVAARPDFAATLVAKQPHARPAALITLHTVPSSTPSTKRGDYIGAVTAAYTQPWLAL